MNRKIERKIRGIVLPAMSAPKRNSTAPAAEESALKRNPTALAAEQPAAPADVIVKKLHYRRGPDLNRDELNFTLMLDGSVSVRSAHYDANPMGGGESRAKVSAVLVHKFSVDALNDWMDHFLVNPLHD